MSALFVVWACVAGFDTADTAGAPVEVCNGLDDDDDGLVDEDFDQDGDGAYTCDAHAGGPDCDDLDPRLVPGAIEACDGLDDDCDGAIPAIEQDLDHDGFRACDGDCDDLDPALTPESADGDGWSSCEGDCDDTRADVSPDAEEACDGVDTDCDGKVPWWEDDNDRDGWSSCDGDCDDLDPFVGPFDHDGDGATPCDSVPDCDDQDATRGPDAVEVCDAVDNDCDGVVDGPQAIDANPWYPDVDGDGYGNAEWGALACDAPPGWIADGSDCFDALADVHPGAEEVCGDGFDNDCDGTVDGACAR